MVDQSCQVLFVEDNKIAQHAGAKILKQIGFEVVLADTGEKAIELASTNSFHFILMDIGLPGIDGCQATQDIRKCQTNRNTPVFAITAHYDNEECKTICHQSGIDKVFSKPLTIEKLSAIMDFMIENENENE